MFKKIILIVGIILICLGLYLVFDNEKIEDPTYNNFLSGNAFANENKNEEALKEYETAMDKNSDINIKKNYEIVKNRISEDQENQDQEKEDNQKNQDNQNDNSDENSNDNSQNDENNMSQEEIEEQQKQAELQTILQRLEGNEKNAFKNNERVRNFSNDKDNKYKW